MDPLEGQYVVQRRWGISEKKWEDLAVGDLTFCKHAAEVYAADRKSRVRIVKIVKKLYKV